MAEGCRKRSQALAKMQITNAGTAADQEELCEIIYNYEDGSSLQDELYERSEQGVDPVA